MPTKLAVMSNEPTSLSIRDLVFDLDKKLAKRIIADGPRSEIIVTWIAHLHTTTDSTRYILRVFDEYDHYIEDDCEPGEIGMWEEELMTASRLVGKDCKCTLRPAGPQKLRKMEHDCKRTVLVYQAPEGDDWEGLAMYGALDRHFGEIKKAFTLAIQELYEKGYYIIHDDYTQVMWSASQKKCVFLNLTSTKKKGSETGDFDAEWELASFALPIYPAKD